MTNNSETENGELNFIGITKDDEIIYEAGQRRCGPPKLWTGSPPGKGCEVFIAKIPKDCFEKELISVFSEVGSIYMFRLMMENETIHRGFGFCIYTTAEAAKEAVSKLNNYQIKKNWYLGICFSVDNCRLFVGGIPKMKTKSDILAEMSKVTENVVDIIVYPSAADKNKNRGFAFVEYNDHKSAAIARKKMIGNGIQLWGHSVAVDWAEPERKVDDEIMSKVKILYVRNLMLNTTEEIIYRQFSQFTKDPEEIVRVKKIGDFAFVHFKTREQAELVKQKMHGKELDGIAIEVHFAKPVNKLEQQQKMLRKNNIPVMLTNEFNSVTTTNNGSKLPTQLAGENNGMTSSRQYRNAAGRCSIKSRQMVKNLDINSDMISNNLTVLLTHICQKHNWGVPYFTIHMVPMVSPNSENSINVFIAQAYIPGLNCHFPSKTYAFTHEEAIMNASESALQWMFYNGIQMPLLLGQVERNDQLLLPKNTNKKTPESEIYPRSNVILDMSDSTTDKHSLNQTSFYMPPQFSYSSLASYFGNIYLPPADYSDRFDGFETNRSVNTNPLQ